MNVGVKQFYISCANSKTNRLERIKQIFSKMEIRQCMIFTNYRDKAEWLTKKLKRDGFEVSCIHGQMEQEARNQVMQKFRSGATKILITTNLLARGIDVPPVSLIINFELPKLKEANIHRVGRSGRFGRRATAIHLVSDREGKMLLDLQEFYAIEIPKLSDDLSEIE